MKKNSLFTIAFVFCLLFSSLSLFAQDGTFNKVTIGTRGSVAGTATRLVLTPYKHTNLWYFNTRDTNDDAYLDILYSNMHQMTFKWNTGVGIGTNNPKYKLDVNGTIRSKEIIVETGWADFVFEPDYVLPSLYEVESHIKTHKHLPGIPSEAEVLENGVGLGEMNVKLLQKVEELTLYMIQQNKKIEKLEEELYLLKNN